MCIVNEEPKRLLCIVSGMNAGGAETFLMKVYRELDKNKYQMDFFVSIQEEGFYDKEIISLGGKIFRSVPKSKAPFRSFIFLRETVQIEKYYYVMRVSQHSLSTLDLLAAKFGGAKTLIFRSSNSDTGGGAFNRLLHFIFKWLPMTLPNIKIAPSTEAAQFVFGKNCIKNGNAIIIKNAISVEDFLFNIDKRNKLRKMLKIEGKFVIGHVGRFNSQKNHTFLIDIFYEIVKKNEDSVLILVGIGELESEIRRKIDTLNLSDKIIFTGVRSDISNLMMAMDIFVFPSFFEGMPNTVIEAQATGLPCVISNSITKEVQITKLIKFIALEDEPKVWADEILLYNNGIERENTKSCFIDKGYDINSVTSQFEKLIFNE